MMRRLPGFFNKMVARFYAGDISPGDEEAEVVALLLVVKVKTDLEMVNFYEKTFLLEYFKNKAFFKSFEKQLLMLSAAEKIDFFIEILRKMELEAFQYGEPIITYGTSTALL